MPEEMWIDYIQAAGASEDLFASALQDFQHPLIIRMFNRFLMQNEQEKTSEQVAR